MPHAISHTSPTSPTAAHHRAAVKKPFRRRDAAPSSSPIPIAAEPALAARRNHLLPFHLCVNPCSSRSADASTRRSNRPASSSTFRSNSCSVMQPCLLFSIYIPTKRMYNPKIKLPAGNLIFPAAPPESDRRSRPPGHGCCRPSAERPSSPASRRGREICASSARGWPDRQTAAARGW